MGQLDMQSTVYGKVHIFKLDMEFNKTLFLLRLLFQISQIFAFLTAGYS